MNQEGVLTLKQNILNLRQIFSFLALALLCSSLEVHVLDILWFINTSMAMLFRLDVRTILSFYVSFSSSQSLICVSYFFVTLNDVFLSCKSVCVESGRIRERYAFCFGINLRVRRRLLCPHMAELGKQKSSTLSSSIIHIYPSSV